MKLNKILAFAVAVLTMTACSDDKVEDYPTFLGGVNSASGVTVSLPQTFKANENQQPFYLPVEVEGQTHGKIVVNVEVKELTSTPAETEPAKEVEHYNVTAKSINIPEGEATGYVEIYPVWETGVINDDRVFEISITGAQGASVGNATCQVTIVNIDDPYTSMCGAWKLTGTDRDGKSVSYNINMKTVSADSEDYGSVLYGFGIFGESDYLLPFTDFEFDEVTGEGKMKLGVGKGMTDGLAFNYGDPVGAAFPVLLVRNAAGNLTMNYEVVCTFDGNYNEVVIPDDVIIVGGLFSNTTLQFTGYTVGQLTNMKLTR